MANPSVDLDFARYLKRRRGAIEVQAREGAAYAYPGDLRVLKTLAPARPVRTALAVAMRLASSVTSSKAGPSEGRSEPAPQGGELPRRLEAAMARAAAQLHVRPARTALSPTVDREGVCVAGTEEDPLVLVSPIAAGALGDAELLHLVGSACGAIQNQHVPYAAAAYHLERSEREFSRWLVAPARAALRAWSHRAILTRDRAGLLCSRNLDASRGAIERTCSDERERRRRTEALSIFAETAFFRGTVGLSDGISMERCNARCAEVAAR